MTPQEEKLMIELQGKWGNRWSRIARRLPGRTDNEIKNYWRTHMRKQAQERKKLSESSKDVSSPSSTITTDSSSLQESGKESFYDTGGHPDTRVREKANDEKGQYEKAYSLDDIWEEVDLTECSLISPVYGELTEEGCSFSGPLVGSVTPPWYNDSPWRIDEEESKLLYPFSDHLFHCGKSEGTYNTDYL